MAFYLCLRIECCLNVLCTLVITVFHHSRLDNLLAVGDAVNLKMSIGFLEVSKHHEVHQKCDSLRVK